MNNTRHEEPTAQQHPLLREPVLTEWGLLNDSEQLRALMKYQLLLLEGLQQSAAFALGPRLRGALTYQGMLVHVFTCEDCAKEREKSGIRLEEMHLQAIRDLFHSFVVSDAPIQADHPSPAEGALLDAVDAFLVLAQEAGKNGRVISLLPVVD